MKRALLISIHPEWAKKILNGEKTIEIRTWIPKDYAGWVYVYITKERPFLNHGLFDDGWYALRGIVCNKKHNPWNGKVAFRFWFENYQTIKWEQCYYEYVKHDLLLETCLTNEQVENYGKGRTLCAWHIDKLEIFDKPKELSEFYRGYDILGNEPKPYLTHQITKAPQKCAWVYIDEKPEPHQVSVLDEETPSEKDESERKPF